VFNCVYDKLLRQNLRLQFGHLHLAEPVQPLCGTKDTRRSLCYIVWGTYGRTRCNPM